jgi:hypothetical protein
VSVPVRRAVADATGFALDKNDDRKLADATLRP